MPATIRHHFPVSIFAPRLALALFAICALLPGLAMAWGNEGHRVTGLVADELLTPKARIRLQHILPNYNLGEVANEMDVNRKALAESIPGIDKWHYDNQPVCGGAPHAEYCPGEICASGKIPQQFRILADEHATREARAQAATFLIHMVGDVHQPLHAADDHDAGANFKTVVLPGPSMARNLHAVWDSDLVKLTLRGVSEANYAKSLLQRYRAREIPLWQKGEIGDWMTDSLRISKTIVYGNLPEFACGVAWSKDRAVPLPQEYVDAALEVIPVQLAKAGARIAYLLNRALDPPPETRPVAP